MQHKSRYTFRFLHVNEKAVLCFRRYPQSYLDTSQSGHREEMEVYIPKVRRLLPFGMNPLSPFNETLSVTSLQCGGWRV